MATKVVEIGGVKALQRRLAAVGKVPEGFLEEWQETTYDLSRQRHAPHRKSGKTYDSIEKGELSKDTAVVEAGGAALFLEFGTKGPYPITPKRAKMLRFKGRAGEWVFARRVTHPGIKRVRPLMVQSGQDAIERFDWGVQVKSKWNKAG